MQAIARIKYLKVSPRKMRRVAELIKGKPVEEALNILNYTPKMAAHHLAKTVKSAAANAISSVGTGKLKAEDLAVTKVMVDQAPTAKRVRFQSMGRVFRIRKRYCHLMVEVEGEPEPEDLKTKTRRRKKDTETEPPAVEKKAKTKSKAKTEKTKAEDKIDKDAEAVIDEKPDSIEEVKEVIDDTGEEKALNDKAEDKNRD